MRRMVSMFVVVIILVFSIPSVLAAEPRTSLMDIAIITEEATHLFSIGWERGDLSVTLIAPDGTRIPQDDPPAGVTVATSDRIIVFRVENAQPGLWKAELKEYDNGKIGVVTQILIKPLLVENVAARQDGGDILVDFALSGEKNKSCDYDVYLTLDGKYQNGRLIKSGTSETGETVSIRCPGDDVSSYDNWCVSVYAECISGGFTDFHSAISEPFTFSNPDAPGQVKELKATLTEDSIRIEWQPPDGEITGYLAVLYGEDGSVAHSVSLGADQTEALLPLFAEGMVKAAVSSVREPVCGLPSSVSVNTAVTLSSIIGFDLPEMPEAAGGYVELAYDTGGASVPLTIDIDGEQDLRTLSGAGMLRLAVHNGTNRITISAEEEDGIWVSQSKKWMIDLIPPALRIYEDWDAIVTAEESVLLAGNVDNADVTVNGSTVQVASNGNFSLEVPLEIGVNLLNITARDASGNTTVYEARVTRKDDTPFPWWLAGGLLAAAIAITVYALLKKGGLGHERRV
ncbi:MAG: hypothetical protein PHO15_04820 [Eubacteriales bacterium]|nr:hypothetical protein [Eubacteriales bacterium]